MSFEQQRDRVSELAAGYTGDMTGFLRDMIAIPSESAGEREAIARAADEMRRVGFDEVKIDGLGNVLGRVGQRARRRGDRRSPRHRRRRRSVHVDSATRTRANCATASSTGAARPTRRPGIAAAVHGARIAKELGLLDGVQLWVTGTVMEEDCDGLCWQYILQRRRAEARGRRHHRADEPRRVSRPPRADGDGGPHAGPLVPRLGARARRQRRLQDGADRRRHRAAERAADGGRRPVPRQGLGHDLARSAPRRRRCARWPTAARSTSIAG